MAPAMSLMIGLNSGQAAPSVMPFIDLHIGVLAGTIEF
jgi:hypothetical protein